MVRNMGRETVTHCNITLSALFFQETGKSKVDFAEAMMTHKGAIGKEQLHLRVSSLGLETEEGEDKQ